MIRFRVLSNEGDTALAYDNFADAERNFKQLKTRGYTGFQVVEGGATKKIDKLNPDVDDLIMIPRIAGG